MIAIAEFAYCGLMYKDTLRTLERKFGKPQAVVSAQFDKLSIFPPLKTHNSDNIINYSAAMSSLVGVFKSLSYDADLKSASLQNQAVQKIPPNMKESWSLFTVKKHWVKPTLLDFYDWLEEKAEAYDLMKKNATKAKPEENNTSVTKTKTASKLFASNSQQKETRKQMSSSSTNTYFHCIVCKSNHRLWECRVFQEKTLTQRAKLMRIANFAFRAYAISTHSASVLNQESAEQTCAKVRITHYCMEQIGFSQRNSQKIQILYSLLVTQAK